MFMYQKDGKLLLNFQTGQIPPASVEDNDLTIEKVGGVAAVLVGDLDVGPTQKDPIKIVVTDIPTTPVVNGTTFAELLDVEDPISVALVYDDGDQDLLTYGDEYSVIINGDPEEDALTVSPQTTVKFIYSYEVGEKQKTLTATKKIPVAAPTTEEEQVDNGEQ